MQMLWFWIASVVVALYVVLDGFDFGAGALSLFVARNDRERRQVLAAIGPFWDGNEVWLLAAGGVLFLAFPKVLASGLSGFYLAIMMVLWVLILRGISIEFRSHVRDAMWRGFFDGVFFLASLLAPVLFGAALGNLVRGLPLDDQGWFALPFFDSFSPKGTLGILDWYTVLAGVMGLVALLHHGALFLTWKTDGPVRERAHAAAGKLSVALIAVWILATLATYAVAPEMLAAVPSRPLALVALLLAIGGIVLAVFMRRSGKDLFAFIGSALFLVGVLASTAAAIFPTMLKSADDPARSLTAINASVNRHALETGLFWWPVGLVIAIGYVVLLFRLHRGTAQAAPEGEGY